MARFGLLVCMQQWSEIKKYTVYNTMLDWYSTKVLLFGGRRRVTTLSFLELEGRGRCIQAWGVWTAAAILLYQRLYPLCWSDPQNRKKRGKLV